MESHPKKRKREEAEHIIPPSISFADAIKQAKLLEVKKWIELGVNVNAFSGTESPLCLAVKVPEPLGLQLVCLLLAAKANPNPILEKNRFYKPPLVSAIMGGRNRIAEALLVAKADTDLAYGEISPLMMAVSCNNLTMLKTLLRFKAKAEAFSEVHEQHVSKKTALSLAIDNEPYQREVVAALLEAKADVKWQNKEGEQLLHIAAKKGNLDAVYQLLKANADIHGRTLFAETPLHFAASNEQGDIVKTLLAAKADINAVSKNGNTALHCVMAGTLNYQSRLKLKNDILKELLQYLFEAKISSNAVNARGETALSAHLNVCNYMLPMKPEYIENTLAALLEQLKKYDAKFRDYIESIYEQAKKDGGPQKVIHLLAKFANRQAISFFAGVHSRAGYLQNGTAQSALAQAKTKHNSIFDVQPLRLALELGGALLPQEKNESQDPPGPREPSHSLA